MPGRLALDFGTSNTVAALWDATAADGRTLPLVNLTRRMRDPHDREFHAVPSLMHYFGATGVWVGQQVMEKNLLAAPGTFRWMKTNVSNQMKLPRYIAGAGFDDRIRHAYALRPYDRATGQYVFKTIVPAGTPYPCDIMRPDDASKPLVLTIKASHDQQTRFGLQVYEMAERTSVTCGGGGLDLVFDQNGAARYAQREDEADVTHREIGSTTFLHCQPPAKLGAPRFLATFAISDQRHLCVTVQDTQTGKTLCRHQPMVKLT